MRKNNRKIRENTTLFESEKVVVLKRETKTRR